MPVTLSLLEELYQESDKRLGDLSGTVHPFSCLQLRKRTDSADDSPNDYNFLQLS